MKRYYVFFIVTILLVSCSFHKNQFDAQGVFESDEVMVSAEVSGRLVSLNLEEGDSLKKDQPIAQIDPVSLKLQKAQLQASIEALNGKLTNADPQIALYNNQLAVQQSQLTNLESEKNRISNLVKSDAATPKQLDDINFQIESLNKQMKVTRQQINVAVASVNNQNKALMSEVAPLQKKIDQVDDLLHKCTVSNPIDGMVLTRYVSAGEMIVQGKPLYKIADISVMKLRVYVTGTQLPQIRLGQTVKVFVDAADKSYKEMQGTIASISSKAEFTPKTIQTKEERANLVYAVKLKVKNDGSLKIGMYGEVKF